jgi:hypothetical protein
MSLYSSIKDLQSTSEKLYLNLEQRFSGNKLIQDLWIQMAQDVSQQIASLRELHKSFWDRFKKDQNELLKTIDAEIKNKNIEIKEDMSLSECIDSAIASEESIILKIYVPLIRNLRKNWTGEALDFYILVKAHIVRIKRVAEEFAGDPAVIQHSALLFHNFEKETQEPEIDIIPRIKKAGKSGKSRDVKTTRAKAVKTKANPAAKATAKTKPKAGSKTRKTLAKTPSLVNRSKIRRSRSKPLIEKSDLRRRRARR